MAEQIDWIGKVTDAGVIGVLVMGIWGFVTGKIWPKEMVEKALQHQRETSEITAKVIATELCEKMGTEISNGIEQAIVRGYLKINSKDVGN